MWRRGWSDEGAATRHVEGTTVLGSLCKIGFMEFSGNKTAEEQDCCAAVSKLYMQEMWSDSNQPPEKICIRTSAS